MSETTTITCHYTPSQLRGLLSKFQDAIDRKQYSEKIPYDTWRKMMRITEDVQIDFVNPFVKIFNPKDNNARNTSFLLKFFSNFSIYKILSIQ